jgi:hypothetical protein
LAAEEHIRTQVGGSERKRVNIVYGSSVFCSKLYGGDEMRDSEMNGILNADGRLEKCGKPEGNIPLLQASRKLEDSALNGS